MAPDSLTGILLVGGASRRFGSPKALARLDGATLAERAWRLLGEVCDERLAVGKTADGLTLPFDLVDDGSEVRAPLAGLVAGLRAARNELSLVVPVDVPLLEPDDLLALAAACADAAVPQTGPLPGAYRRTSLAVLERRLADGELALHDALAELDVLTVELPAARLANANTPAELALLGAPPIVPLERVHGESYRRLVVGVLGEFGFAEDAALDRDLLDPAAEYAAAWVAVDGGDVVGSVALQRLGPDEALLRRMYVLPGLRDRGLGRRLLAVALAGARALGIRTLLLDTTEEMAAARHLYESAGFHRIERTDERQGRCRIYYALRLPAGRGF